MRSPPPLLGRSLARFHLSSPPSTCSSSWTDSWLGPRAPQSPLLLVVRHSPGTPKSGPQLRSSEGWVGPIPARPSLREVGETQNLGSVITFSSPSSPLSSPNHRWGNVRKEICEPQSWPQGQRSGPACILDDSPGASLSHSLCCKHTLHFPSSTLLLPGHPPHEKSFLSSQPFTLGPIPYLLGEGGSHHPETTTWPQQG